MSVRGASPTELRGRAGRDPTRTLVAKAALGAALVCLIAVVISALVVATMAAALMSHGYHWFTDIVGGVFTAGIWVCGLTFPAYVLWTDPKLSSVLGSVRSRPACRL